MVLEGGVLKDVVCAQIIEELRKNYPNIWGKLQSEAAAESGASTLAYRNTKLTFRLSHKSPTKYTCSLFETQWPSDNHKANHASNVSPTFRTQTPRTSEVKPSCERLPIALEQLICSLSKAYEIHGTPSEHLSCLPLLTQGFWPDDYSSPSHHVICIPELVLLFLVDDEDMKVDESFQFEHLMSIPQGRKLYQQLKEVLALYKTKGAVVEFNGQQLHTHSGVHLSASDIVASLKSYYLMTKAMAMPFDCVWAPSDYPLFTKRSNLSYDDCLITATDVKSTRDFHDRYMRGNLHWFPKTQIHGVTQDVMEQLEIANMEEIIGEGYIDRTSFEMSEPIDSFVSPNGSGDDESETRSEASWACSEDMLLHQDGNTSDNNYKAVYKEVPPEIRAMSSLIDIQHKHNSLGNKSVDDLLNHIPHVTRGCYYQGLWYPHHLTFRTPFPFQGFILWRAYVYFGQCVAACPVNITDSIGDWESDSAKVDKLKRALSRKVAELQRVWDGQATMSNNDLPKVWRYCVDVWVKDDEVWTERIRPISKSSSLLFTWEELRQWGIFKQMPCGVVIRVPESATSAGSDDFVRLFAGQRPISQRI